MKFYVIGMDDSSSLHFLPQVKELIANSTIFSGGVRHREIVKGLLPKGSVWIDIIPPMGELFERYNSYSEIVVFASGDPLFFGFAATIQKFMPSAEVITFPHFNSLQQLANITVLPYHDMINVSLTGRDWLRFDEALICGYRMVGVLTDNKLHTPQKIAERMLAYGYSNYRITVGELLGNEGQQRVSRQLSVNEVALLDFAYPNCMILEQTLPRPRAFGIDETQFLLLDNRQNMITKMPIRLLTLSKLELRESKVFWDVGFCTGSVSVEAKSQFPHLQIVSFEVRKSCQSLIDGNAKKFGTPGITAVMGDFVETDISKYPRPDAVFIGGHGGKMIEILTKISGVINDNGKVVFNSVSPESEQLFIDSAKKTNFEITDRCSITIDNHNKIDILKAVKSPF